LAIIGWSIVGVIFYQIAIVEALTFTNASHVGLILGLEPIIILLMASFGERSRPSNSLFLSILLGAVGVVSVVGISRKISGGEVGGDLLALLGASSWSLYVVGTRSISRRYSSAAMTSVSVFGTGFVLFAYSIASARGAYLALTSTDIWLLILVVMVSTVGGFLAWNYGVSHTSSSRAGVFLYLTPLASVVGAVLVLGERLSFADVFGGLAILGALLISGR
jgi:drug/metabolite transporter (DMT)-like permease